MSSRVMDRPGDCPGGSEPSTNTCLGLIIRCRGRNETENMELDCWIAKVVVVSPQHGRRKARPGGSVVNSPVRKGGDCERLKSHRRPGGPAVILHGKRSTERLCL